MNLLKPKIFFKNVNSLNAMVDGLISERIRVLSVEGLQTKSNIILLVILTKAEYDIIRIENAVWIGEKD